MNPNRLKILEMLKDGKISLEEAEQLLARIESKPRTEERIELHLHAEDDADAVAPAMAEAVAGASALKERIAETVQRKLDAAFGRNKTGESRSSSSSSGRPKYLRVLVQSHDGDRVNVRVPMALIRMGIALSALLPESAQDAISDAGLDFSAFAKLKGDDLVDALMELTIDVQSHDGDKVQVFCE